MTTIDSSCPAFANRFPPDVRLVIRGMSIAVLMQKAAGLLACSAW